CDCKSTRVDDSSVAFYRQNWLVIQSDARDTIARLWIGSARHFSKVYNAFDGIESPADNLSDGYCRRDRKRVQLLVQNIVCIEQGCIEHLRCFEVIKCRLRPVIANGKQKISQQIEAVN